MNCKLNAYIYSSIQFVKDIDPYSMFDVGKMYEEDESEQYLNGKFEDLG